MKGKPFPAAAPHDALRRRLALSGGLVAFGLAACTGEGERGGAKQPPAPATTPSVPTAKAVDAPDLEAHGIQLPGLIESASEGLFIDLFRALDSYYTEGNIVVRVYPSARVHANAEKGLADFVFPVVRLGPEAEAKMSLRYATESIGRVSFVLYSQRDHMLDRRKLAEAAQRGQAFKVQAPSGDWGVPTEQFIGFVEAFRLLESRRIDGFLWAQEEADLVLHRLGLKSIHRAHFQDFDDTLLVPRTPRGAFVDQMLTRAIQRMRESGELAHYHARVHRPFEDWQPYRAQAGRA